MEPAFSGERPGRGDLEALFVASLPDIDRIIRFVARRNRLSGAEADDFEGEVKLALVDNDYDVLARFQKRSSLRTYLTTVVQRLFLDYRRKQWGKWRPSAEAQHRGAVALRMESLVYRDGLSFAEAAETLRMNAGVSESVDQLTDLARSLPVRARKQVVVGEEALPNVPADDLANPAIQMEGSTTAVRLQALLTDSLDRLRPQDRLVMRFRFEDEMSVADIARMLKLDQKPLYRRIDDLLGSLRKSLENDGFAWPEVQQMIERGQCHLCLSRPAGETVQSRPSQREAQV